MPTVTAALTHTSKTLLVAALSAALVVPTITTADAGQGRKHWNKGGGHHHVHKPRHRHGKHHHRRHRKNNDLGAALAIGVIGLAAGAMLGSALSAPQPIHPDPVYVPRYPRGYGPAYPVYQPAPPVVVDRYRPAPWTAEWYRYCDAKYRSFNPRTGMFTTYSGVQKLCR